MSRFLIKIMIVIFILTNMMLYFSSCGFKNKSSTSEAVPISDKFDYVIAGEDNCFMVVKTFDTIDGFHEEIGVVDANSNWIQPLSSKHPFLEDGKLPIYAYAKKEERPHYEKNKCVYMKDGMFFYNHDNIGIIYNSKNNSSFTIDEFGEEEKVFVDGYWVVRKDRGAGNHEILIVNKNGKITHTGVNAEYIGKYSEGVFFASNGKFYDIHMNVKIDLSKYNIINYATFHDGKCKIIIKNDNGSEFETEIDHKGKFLYEPKNYINDETT